MLALYRCGRRADALEVYRDGHRRSVGELGIEPSGQLRELQARILEEAPQLAAPLGASAQTAARRSSVAIIAAGILLAAVAVAVFVRERETSAPALPVLDIAANSAVGIDSAGSGLARFALPLPGRPTDIAADGDRLFAVSIDSSALTIVAAATRRLERTIPLAMRPAALAVSADGVWIADGRRGLVVRMDRGYERVVARATWARAPRREAVGLSDLDSTAAAVAGAAVWVTDGSSRLVRVDGRVRLTRLRTPHPLDGIVAGAGARGR